MIIKQLLEFTRVMWKKHCDMVAEAKENTHEGRQKRDMLSLYKYLQEHPENLPTEKQYLLEKHESFFVQSQLDNVLMWKEAAITAINDDSITPLEHRNTSTAVTNTHDVRRYCKKIKPKKPRKRGRKPKLEKKTDSKKRKTKMRYAPQTIQEYFHAIHNQSQKNDELNEDNDTVIDIVPEDSISPVISKRQKRLDARNAKKKRKEVEVNELDDYKIVRRTNMVTYRKRLDLFRKRLKASTSPTNESMASSNEDANDLTVQNSNEMIYKRKFDELNAQQESGGNLSPGFKGRTRSPSPVGATIRENCKKRRKNESTDNYESCNTDSGKFLGPCSHT